MAPIGTADSPGHLRGLEWTPVSLRILASGPPGSGSVFRTLHASSYKNYLQMYTGDIWMNWQRR
jgi:hypothetical protein